MNNATDDLCLAAEHAAHKLKSLGRMFSSTNFTDRYDDGPACLALAERLLEALRRYNCVRHMRDNLRAAPPGKKLSAQGG